MKSYIAVTAQFIHEWVNKNYVLQTRRMDESHMLKTYQKYWLQLSFMEQWPSRGGCNPNDGSEGLHFQSCEIPLQKSYCQETEGPAPHCLLLFSSYLWPWISQHIESWKSEERKMCRVLHWQKQEKSAGGDSLCLPTKQCVIVPWQMPRPLPQ